MKLVAKTLFGLEEVLASELAGLGAGNITVLNRAVAFEGSKSLLYRVNYNSRLAMSVLVPVASFAIAGQKDLYNGASDVDWDRYLDPRMTFAVSAVVKSRYFTHSGYAALVVKDAIADFFRRLTGTRPSVNQETPDLLVNIHISNEKVTISLDSTVIPLYKRGYRRGQSGAPLSEVLAAGMIALSGWSAERPLVDGMCGSGTIPIEAALMASNIAPGKFRKSFGFMKWKDYDPALLRSVKYDAEKHERPSPVRIYAGDISSEACATARLNVMEAGVADTVEVAVRDFLDAPAPAGEGTLIINPPYGRRMMTGDMSAFYGSIGSVLKHYYPGYRAWILSGDRESLKSVALKPFRKISLLNGDIECLFAGYDLYAGSRQAASPGSS